MLEKLIQLKEYLEHLYFNTVKEIAENEKHLILISEMIEELKPQKHNDNENGKENIKLFIDGKLAYGTQKAETILYYLKGFLENNEFEKIAIIKEVTSCNTN